MKLLGKRSSINVRKVLWACHEIGLEIEQEDWGSGFRDTSDPAFRALNPNGLVPVLLDEDLVLWESNSILRYLAARYGSRDLLPAEPKARAGVEQWMDWQATELNGAWRYAFTHLVRQPEGTPDAALLRESLTAWADTMGILDESLARSGGYAVGGAFTLADIPLGLSVNRWFMTPMERPTLTEVDAYYDRLAERPGFKLFGRNGVP